MRTLIGWNEIYFSARSFLNRQTIISGHINGNIAGNCTLKWQTHDNDKCIQKDAERERESGIHRIQIEDFFFLKLCSQ